MACIGVTAITESRTHGPRTRMHTVSTIFQPPSCCLSQSAPALLDKQPFTSYLQHNAGCAFDRASSQPHSCCWCCLPLQILLLPAHYMGASELLHALSHLQRLTHLNLDFEHSTLRPTDQTSYSALTASSLLQHLRLQNVVVYNGYPQHVFTPGRPLHHLTALHIMNVQTHGALEDVGIVPSGLVERIAVACPRVQELSIHWVDETCFSALRQLEALTSLDLQGGWGKELLKDVAALRGLRNVRFYCNPGAYVCGPLEAMQLTSLTQLTRLEVLSTLLPGGRKAFCKEVSTRERMSGFDA